MKLRKISINSKSNIESEEQVKDYISAIEKDIEKLKNEMLEAIKNNKIVEVLLEPQFYIRIFFTDKFANNI